MCYDISSGLKAKIKYAKHRGEDEATVKQLEILLEEITIDIPKFFHVSGFAHPKLLTFTNKEKFIPKLFTWGLIPPWIKDTEAANTISNQTLNARVETIFEKPSFRNAAINNRCLIYIDGFFEHRHFKGKTYPYYLSMKDKSPMILAGLWEEWLDKQTGEVFETVSIVTTKANTLMSKIHHNPKLEEGRMPVILSRETQDQWLTPIKIEDDKNNLLQLTLPFPEELLNYHTVRKLKGKDAVGNTEQAIEEYYYPELEVL